ncbi:MAG TPA: GNAT family protein [Methylibium sp.]
MKQELHSARLLLRPPRPGDEHAAHALWASDPQVLRYLHWKPHTQLAQTRSQLAWEQARWIKRSAWTWLIVPLHKPVGEQQLQPIGLVQLTPQQRDGEAHHLRLGYLLARRHWGRGLMREALDVVLAQAFSQAAVWRIDAVCDLENVASERVLRACGFRLEGVLARYSLHPNRGTQPRDAALYARVRSAGP